MDPEWNLVHIIFLVDGARGLMIPAVDMARMFARHGSKVTIVTTPIAATTFSKALERDTNSGFDISFHTLKFPAAEVGLPEGSENASSVTSPDMMLRFLKAVAMLQEPLEQFLRRCKPTCLVAGMLHPWAKQVADKFGIPRFFFSGYCCFSTCVYDSLIRFKPFKRVESDFEPLLVPGIPDKITMKKVQLASFLTEEEGENKSEIAKLLDQAKEAEMTSDGILMNSFYDLEPGYAELLSNITGTKIWLVGPISCFNKTVEDKVERGNVASINGSECLKLLDSKQPNSVVYVCFGSVVNFSTAQLLEIALGLELSGKKFIWVVRTEQDEKEWLPEGFEKRVEGKGLIIRGWGPQVMILEHEAIGGFISHCGWNSTLEALTAGVPLVTWPLMAEQFVNEKFITDVLKVGVGVGAEEWSRLDSKSVIGKEEIWNAVNKLMEGDDAETIRSRAKWIKEKADSATREGGSSQSAVKALLEELKSFKMRK